MSSYRSFFDLLFLPEGRLLPCMSVRANRDICQYNRRVTEYNTRDLIRGHFRKRNNFRKESCHFQTDAPFRKLLYNSHVPTVDEKSVNTKVVAIQTEKVADHINFMDPQYKKKSRSFSNVDLIFSKRNRPFSKVCNTFCSWMVFKIYRGGLRLSCAQTAIHISRGHKRL